ncbi:MAG: hypothetical protein Q9180_009995, partial [Flavoplaca navasiana]
YFMSLKVLGRWRRWSKSLGRHWGSVQEKLHGRNGMSVLELGDKTTTTTTHKHTLSGNVKREEEDAASTHHCGDDDSDDDDAVDVLNVTSDSATIEKAEKEERETYLARSVVRHWMRVAKIKSAGVVEDEEVLGQRGIGTPDWTRGIAPKLEGRIVIEI